MDLLSAIDKKVETFRVNLDKKPMTIYLGNSEWYEFRNIAKDYCLIDTETNAVEYSGIPVLRVNIDHHLNVG